MRLDASFSGERGRLDGEAHGPRQGAAYPARKRSRPPTGDEHEVVRIDIEGIDYRPALTRNAWLQHDARRGRAGRTPS
jgi:hypothetical protein